MNTFLKLPADFCADVERAHTLPAAYYTQPQVFEQEKEAIFAKSWICIGHRSEVAESNAYITREIDGVAAGDVLFVAHQVQAECGAVVEELAVHVECVAADRKSTRLNSSHVRKSRMPSSA